jgi:hypothetical protein
MCKFIKKANNEGEVDSQGILSNDEIPEVD